MTYCLAQGDKCVSLPVYWAKLAQWRNIQMLELVQGWGRTAQLAALAGFLKTGQESLSKKGTRCTYIWRGIWLPQHNHLMPIRGWGEPVCPPAAIPAAQVLCHLCKSHKDTSDGLRVNSNPGRIIFSICLSFISFKNALPKGVQEGKFINWEVDGGQSQPGEVETDSSPGTSPTWLHHITLPTSLASCEAGYSYSRQPSPVSPHQSTTARYPEAWKAVWGMLHCYSQPPN